MTLTEKKALVAQFIGKCNEYADGMLERYHRELAHASPREALTIQDKIGHWTAYRAFNHHTLEELATERLDHWFS
jgi:hypothetical protein